jgi:soluble lytic murein transglycosylase
MARSRTSQRRAHAFLAWALFLSSLTTISSPIAAQQTQREQFADAWSAAARGDRSVFSRLPAGLETYQLFPYLVYEQLRLERARTRPEEIGIFLDQHDDWAFSRGLRNSWLKTLARQQKWSEFLRYYQPSTNTELRCHKAEAQIRTGQLAGLLAEAQALWAVGKSQPDECDPVFAWLNRSGGITAALAWQRVYQAIATGNARFTLYLARFIPAHDRVWLERWQDINRSGYRRLNLALNWSDLEITREIVSLSLKRLALSDSGRAWDLFQSLDSHFTWDANQRGSIIRDCQRRTATIRFCSGGHARRLQRKNGRPCTRLSDNCLPNQSPMDAGVTGMQRRLKCWVITRSPEASWVRFQRKRAFTGFWRPMN